jgi:hypothetical protein
MLQGWEELSHCVETGVTSAPFDKGLIFMKDREILSYIGVQGRIFLIFIGKK